jgi:hypothetical protein
MHSSLELHSSPQPRFNPGSQTPDVDCLSVLPPQSMTNRRVIEQSGQMMGLLGSDPVKRLESLDFGKFPGSP